MNKVILITDIGSTTTKAILVSNREGKWLLDCLANAPTTVEKPQEDVMIGVINAVHALQAQTEARLLTADGQINPELQWLSTSSAGGGLQILVIGLVKEESAASAQRAAYGVGGVLLDTIAIDDGRNVVEQMHTIEDKHPDIILLSGGYEGGAYASVLRQAEILSYCEIRPKYLLKDKIPVIFAGNADAANAVKNILQDSFEVHILANIRPTEAIEQTEHVSELVHELFLNKVMQQAPGYSVVSKMVSSPVIPTPLGVMNALKAIAEGGGHNILAVDIGGATTDVYSNLFGRFYRTVSANFGMSYNLCNVLAKADYAALSQWLHPELPEAELRDYVANKMLNPTQIPSGETTLHIEQALARIALQLSLKQHLQMNFSVEHIGHFLKIKTTDYDQFHEQFYREKLNARKEFRLQDYDVIIGAGGVISHAPQPKQAAIMLIDGLQPRGITSIWRDRHFTTPHLGKLCEIDEKAAYELLKTEGLETLCLCVRPLPGKIKAGKPALRVELAFAQETRTIDVEGNKLLWIENDRQVQIKVTPLGGVKISHDQKECSTETQLPILIDTRISGKYSFAELNKELNLYSNIAPADTGKYEPKESLSAASISRGTCRRTFSLPYAGRIYVNEGDAIDGETVLGENLYDPPRIFVLQIFRGRESYFQEDAFRQNLLVKIGEEVKSGQLIYKEQVSFLESLMSASHYNYHSPVRGQVEKIDYKNGTVLLREIQDYSFAPVTVHLADKLGVKPRNMLGYMHKRKGDFITNGEILAAKSMSRFEHIVHSPATGTITEINTAKGTVTIRYWRKNLRLKSYLKSTVKSISRHRFIELEYEGTTITGSIGFGKVKDGQVVWNDTLDRVDLMKDSIAVFPFALSREQLEVVKENRPAGIIVPSMREEDLVRILGYELGVGITGDEDIPFSIIITEGFGNLSFSEELATALKDCSGKRGVLFPDTQIRAGVIRPSLVVQ